jgi:hypothetical protein
MCEILVSTAVPDGNEMATIIPAALAANTLAEWHIAVRHERGDTGYDANPASAPR